MTTRGLAASAVAAVLLVSRAASAQAQYVAQPDSPEWLKDRRYNEGIGIRTGDLELHPGIAGEGGYDSNYLLRSTTVGVANGPPLSPRHPGARVSRHSLALPLDARSAAARGRQRRAPSPLAFRAGFNATYRELVGLSSDRSRRAEQRYRRAAQPERRGRRPPRHPPGAAGRGRALRRATRAPSCRTRSTRIQTCRSTRTTSAAAPSSRCSPGAERSTGTLATSCTRRSSKRATGKPYDNLVQEAYTRGRWKFRPRTAFVYDATFRFITYNNAELAEPVPLDTSTPIRARIGLDGLITDRFALLAMVGWGASFYDTTLPNQPQFDSVDRPGRAPVVSLRQPGHRQRRRTSGSPSRRSRSGTRAISRIAISAATTRRTAAI